MLGDHGMYSKFVFYEGSAHIPLLVRLPGVIPAGKVVDALPSRATRISFHHPRLLRTRRPRIRRRDKKRPLNIEGMDDPAHHVVVSEWGGTAVFGYMVCDGRWKLGVCIGPHRRPRSRDGLFDLQSDPNEIKNLPPTKPTAPRTRRSPSASSNPSSTG